MRASLNLYGAVDAIVTHDGPARPEFAPRDQRPPLLIRAARNPVLPRDGGGGFVVRAARGAVARDHVERAGAVTTTLPAGTRVVALREAVPSCAATS